MSWYAVSSSLSPCCRRRGSHPSTGSLAHWGRQNSNMCSSTSATMPPPGNSIISVHFEDIIKVPNQLTLTYRSAHEPFKSSFLWLVAEVRERDLFLRTSREKQTACCELSTGDKVLPATCELGKQPRLKCQPVRP